MNIKAKSLQEGMSKLTKHLRKRLPEVLDAQITERQINNIYIEFPTTTGQTVTRLKPKYSGVYKRTHSIMALPAHADLLERGTRSSQFPSNPYSVFIPDWVNAKGLTDKFPSGWVIVGNPTTTHWGRNKNKWFTNSVKSTRKDLNKITIKDIER